MIVKKADITMLTLIAATVAVGVLAYPVLPEQIAGHWNAQGEADGMIPKFWGIFLFPLIMVFLYALYFFIPRFDPLQRNFDSFRRSYELFWVTLQGFFAYLFVLTMFWHFGYRFNFTLFIVPPVAILWSVIGVVIEASKRNWFMGIRTPWTLSDDVVWEKTHRLGGKLFRWSAFLTLLILFFPRPEAVIVFLVMPAVVIALVTTVYSYLVFRERKRSPHV